MQKCPFIEVFHPIVCDFGSNIVKNMMGKMESWPLYLKKKCIVSPKEKFKKYKSL